MPTGLHVRHPLTGEQLAGVGGQLRADGLRRRRGDGRAGARRARLRVRAEVFTAGAHGGASRRAAPTTTWRAVAGSLRPSTACWWIRASSPGLTSAAAVDAIAAALASKGPGRRSACSIACATGAFRASVTGAARSRIIHCAKCGDVPVPDKDLPVRAARRTWCRMAAAIRWPRRRRSSSASARSAAPMRGAKPTPWTPSWIRPGISCASPARQRRRPWSTRAPTTGCRWTSTSAASSTPSCTCCIRASGHASCATWGW